MGFGEMPTMEKPKMSAEAEEQLRQDIGRTEQRIGNLKTALAPNTGESAPMDTAKNDLEDQLRQTEQYLESLKAKLNG